MLLSPVRCSGASRRYDNLEASRVDIKIETHTGCRGSMSVNTAPPPVALAAVKVPPCRRAFSAAMARPRPLPSLRARAASPLVKRSKMCGRAVSGTSRCRASPGSRSSRRRPSGASSVIDEPPVPLPAARESWWSSATHCRRHQAIGWGEGDRGNRNRDWDWPSSYPKAVPRGSVFHSRLYLPPRARMAHTRAVTPPGAGTPRGAGWNGHHATRPRSVIADGRIRTRMTKASSSTAVARLKPICFISAR